MSNDSLRDAIFLGGLLLIGLGLWWIYPPLSLIGVGSILAVLSYRSGGKVIK